MPRRIKKKTIKTIYGRMKNEGPKKAEYFAELCRIDDMRISNAQTSLHSRLTEEERAEACRWSAQYNLLLGENGD
tara:strand:- start:191 stop:415 length:225 start_codon:yes stop_codon:yes gene_type:complete